MAILKVKSGWDEVSQFHLKNEPMKVGRNKTCHVRLQGPKISRDHAQIEPADGGFIVTDLGSTNGTFVNNKPIRQKVLAPGDELDIGGDVVLIYVPDETDDDAVDIHVAPPAGAEAEQPVVDSGVNTDALAKMKDATDAIRLEVSKVIVGQDEVLNQVLTAMLARGHCLMVGVPGLAKTLMISTISRILDLSFKRVQFTPDLMPSDITGTDILEVDEQTGAKSFRFIQGPIFTNMLLADEINRTPPKTQASLLEAMQERSVTASGHTYKLEEPFFVLATQNPLEQEGTYPLPEAQLDRFMFNILVDYPSEIEEELIVKRTTFTHEGKPDTVLTASEIVDLQKTVWRIPVPDSVIRYATELVRASRPGHGEIEFVEERVQCGAGPRACQYLILGSKARAVLDGRSEATIDDVKACAVPVMRHRIFVNFNALSEGVSATDIVRKLLKNVDPPAEDGPIVRSYTRRAPRREEDVRIDDAIPAGSELNLDAIRKMKVASSRICDEMQKVIVGQTDVIDEILMAMLSRGHCLMVGVPGLAKTLMIRTLASVLDLSFKRVRFTPDLMPSDITGTDILEEDEHSGEKTFRFIRGPIFTNMLLADEINRTPPKTQAALLEAMQEYSVTASGNTYDLDLPFFVLATQNPLEQEGTYPLPEAQLDRFMFNIWVDYPEHDEEDQIVKETTRLQTLEPRKVIGADEIIKLQQIVRRVPVSDHVIKYATRLVRATRPGVPSAPDFIDDWVYCGAGPRACQYLILGAKARAVLDGRANVSCNDVRRAALPVMRHRIFTNFNADSEGVSTVDIVERLIGEVAEPGEKDYAPSHKRATREKRTKSPEAAVTINAAPGKSKKKEKAEETEDEKIDLAPAAEAKAQPPSSAAEKAEQAEPAEEEESNDVGGWVEVKSNTSKRKRKRRSRRKRKR